MLRDISADKNGSVKPTLILPFSNIPENTRNFLVYSLSTSVEQQGGKMTGVKQVYMSDQERQTFLTLEQLNWRS